MFLRLTDRYPMRVPIKGGFVDWVPVRIWITANYGPDILYNRDPAVLRRIDEIYEFRA